MARTYWLETLGCKLNQADTTQLEAGLWRAGMRPAPTADTADLLVVNTCTVTARADSDGRQALRRLARRNAGGLVVAMGCYARRDPEALRRLTGVHLVAPGSDPRPVLEAAERAFPGDLTRESEPYHSVPKGIRTRAFLRVQDGCRLACSYCIIPTVRGDSRSTPADEVAAALERLIEAGFLEVVLTGVNTGDWGRDLPGRPRLLDLLRRLTAVPGLGRLRLNSLEPRTLHPDLIEFLADTDRIAPHLQIPLQSGSDRILAAMRRNYRAVEYRSLLDHLARRMPDIGLGADVIVGFPGESEDDFAETLAMVRDTPLSYLHVFSYSARPGTDAELMPDAVAPARTAARSRRLRQEATHKGTAFRLRFVGRVLQAIVLSDPAADGRLRALTGNFFEVRLPPGSAPAGALLPVRILDAGSEESAASGEPAAVVPVEPVAEVAAQKLCAK